MLDKQTIHDIQPNGKRIIIRVDFNVPLDENKKVRDDLRIKSALPTIQYLLDNGAAVILMSHLGRPKGSPNPDFSLHPVYEHLKTLLPDTTITFADDCRGTATAEKAAALQPGQILLLENLRYYKEEEKNDPEFAKELASYADIYVNDAFGTAHRAHASTEGITHYLSPAVAGLLLKKEIDYLENTLEDPARPFIAIMGGAKVSDKILVIERLLDKVNAILIGGGMMFTFYKAQGLNIGSSKCEDEAVTEAKRLLTLAAEKGVDLVLPTDTLIATEFSNESERKNVPVTEIPDGWMGLDIGPDTIKLFDSKIRASKTIIWNGPMGVFEFPNFATGTFEAAKSIAGTDCISIVGGGDSAAAIKKSGLTDKFTHISTGGGASLEMLEGKPLPGVLALTDK